MVRQGEEGNIYGGAGRKRQQEETQGEMRRTGKVRGTRKI